MLRLPGCHEEEQSAQLLEPVVEGDMQPWGLEAFHWAEEPPSSQAYQVL